MRRRSLQSAPPVGAAQEWVVVTPAPAKWARAAPPDEEEEEGEGSARQHPWSVAARAVVTVRRTRKEDAKRRVAEQLEDHPMHPPRFLSLFFFSSARLPFSIRCCLLRQLLHGTSRRRQARPTEEENRQTVQSQHRAERDAAIARLEQSRLVLAMRLAEHQGKRYRVIDEALAFVGEVSDKNQFISPEDVRAAQTEDNADGNRGSSSRTISNMLSCSLSLAKNSFRLDKIGGALGNAAVFAVSMLAFLQLHQIAFGSKTPAVGYRKRIEYNFQSVSSQQDGKGKHLEVHLARG
ncbi:unnamed protein product [Urochloa decumbens]|uniref:Plastid division protein PDV1 n=1 Tax=Urochloa decumbens TaxID=240449 RepID=A0ABC9CMF1_9POAL